MRLTSTTIPNWKSDCADYARKGEDFTLSNVATEEHQIFCREFCAKHNYESKPTQNPAVIEFNPKPN